MADRYWVGGAANWNNTAATKWATTSGGVGGASVPTIADDVYYDNNSGVVNVSIATGYVAFCNSLNFVSGSGSFAGTFDNSTTGSSITCATNLTISSAMTWTYRGTITFTGTTAGNVIISNGTTIESPLIFNGAGGSWALQDALTTGSARAITLTAGTLDLNNKNLTCGSISSNNSNTRAILFGTGQIYLTGNSLAILNIPTATGYTTSGTPVINCTYSGATGTRTLRFGNTAGATEANVPSINITAGTDIVLLGPSAYKSVNFTGFAGSVTTYDLTLYGGLTVSSGMTLGASTTLVTFAATSGTNNVTTNGKTLDFPVTFNGIGGTWALQDAFTVGATRTLTLSNGTVKFKNGTTNTAGTFAVAGNAVNQLILSSTTAGATYTLSQTSGTVDAVYTTITDSTATGGATWNALVANGNIDGGNNSGWNFGVAPPPFTSDFQYPITLRSFTQPRRF